jgi:hypothetical protein
MPAAATTLDQIDLDVRPKRWYAAVGTAALLVGACSLVASVVAEAWGGVFAALVPLAIGAVTVHLALAAHLVVRASTLAVRTPYREREVRLDRLTTVGLWRGRFGEPHLALGDRFGNRVVVSSPFWEDGRKVEAVIGVALAEHDDVEVSNRLANRLDDLACLHFG